MSTPARKKGSCEGIHDPELQLALEIVQADGKPDSQRCLNLDVLLRESEAARARLTLELAEIKAAQQQFLERYVRLEEQNCTLTTLYVACQRLHSTLDRSEVLLTVREIIANLIGCEEFALITQLPDGELRLLDAWGLAMGTFDSLRSESGLIARTLQTGEIYLRGESDGRDAIPAEAHLTACIPLKREGIVTGAIALFRLLPQKFEIQELDLEMFRLLGTHLALALYCTELHERARSTNGAAA